MRSTVTKNTIQALLCRPIVPSIKTLVGALILVGATALPVLACGSDSPQAALNIFGLPLVASTLFYGLPLLLSILVESAILHYRESIGWLKSFGLSLLTNIGGLIVMLMGMIASYGFFPFTSFPALALQGLLLSAMLITFSRKTGCCLRLTKGIGQMSVYILLLGLSYASFFLDYIVDNSRVPSVILPPIAGLLLTGFLFNLIVEGWILSLAMPKLRPQLGATVISMNVWSYGLIPASMLLSKYVQGVPLFS